ncbi:YbhN family protein [Amycolatopsis sp. PS_44_ISF1]|uniref:lysylphosphatidylglycerol synthase transmembrane domain-containing protein n=1 Tax=Amycolatopsis sp. PS_44_ISF1 TaxID=2974917 RepID=UPI0028DEDEDF|nr:YbhN family protein [Amycolatopsis sp. PS_44_ISF1]MDT8912525.1 YbhN family protein [Amycolatopsis sp. PS_44_ISF1]
MTGLPSSSPAGPDRKASGRVAVTRRGVLTVVLVAVVVACVVVEGHTITEAVHGVARASPRWLLLGLAATVGSMVAFAVMRALTLAAAGSRVSILRTIAISYGAGAVHATLPAGAVFSTTYAFRSLRRQGASSSAVTWSLTVTGLLSAVTLGAVGLVGVGLSGGALGSAPGLAVKVLASIAVFALVVRLVRRPQPLVRLGHRLLRRYNRARRRPPETGHARLDSIVEDLYIIRPAGYHWIGALLLAVLNWVLDLACLAACCAAVGMHVGLPVLLLTYAAGMAAGGLLPVPSGLGAVEAAMALSLTVSGGAGSALASVLLYRVLSTGSVVLIGWIVVATQHFRPGREHQDQPGHRHLADV